MMYQQTLLLIGALATMTTSAHAALRSIVPDSILSMTPHRQALELGKYADGAESEIDCSLAQHDYSYYIERCFDDKTQWWINGHCINNVKHETSELHLCMRPNGERSNCFDCGDGSGNIKNVCGSDEPDEEAVCALAWLGNADNCGDQGLTVYNYQCKAGSESEVDYMRESFTCHEERKSEQSLQITCGDEWFYEFSQDLFPDMDIKGGHPYATSDSKYCLDCGMAIQVCAGGDGEATCERLGLPPKGESTGGEGFWETEADEESSIWENTVATDAPPEIAPVTQAPVTIPAANGTATEASELESVATADSPGISFVTPDATLVDDASDTDADMPTENVEEPAAKPIPPSGDAASALAQNSSANSMKDWVAAAITTLVSVFMIW